MTKTTFRDLLKLEMFEQIEDITASIRPLFALQELPAVVPTRFSPAKVKEIQNAFFKHRSVDSVSYSFFEAMAVILDAPELIPSVRGGTENKVHKSFKLFSAIKVNTDTTGHRYPLATPFLVTSVKSGYGLDKDGEIANYTYKSEHDLAFSIASTEEVKQMVDTFNDAQWHTIMSSDLFSPFVHAAMDRNITAD